MAGHDIIRGLSLVGHEVGVYRIVAEIGRGGMGVVYLAEHQNLGRRAAIKVLSPELARNAENVGRFLAEARAVARLDHPGIVRIFDCDRMPDGGPFLAMELLEGEPLSAPLARYGRFDTWLATDIARQIAEALAAAHAKGVVHRDLKPDNVFVLATPPHTIKVLDFGVAKLLSQSDHPSRTRSGVMLGTPQYMSPEQCQGAKTIDHRTDVYALGCVLFEMLCGRPPFQDEGVASLFAAHMSQRPPDPAALAPGVPGPLAALILRMLAKAPAERLQSMAEVAGALSDLGLMLRAPAATMRLTAGSAQAGARTPVRARPGAAGGTPVSEPIPPTGAMTTERVGPRRAWPALLVVLPVVVAGAGVMWLAWPEPPAAPVSLTTGRPQPAASAAAPPRSIDSHRPAAAPPPPTPPAAVTAPAPAPAPIVTARETPARVRVRVLSRPPRAAVCSRAGRRLGWTGDTLELAAGARATLLVGRHGYRTERIVLVPREGLERTVTLTRPNPDELLEFLTCE